MDTYRGRHDKENNVENDYAYQAPDLPASRPSHSKLANSNFGNNLLRALRLSNQAQAQAGFEGAFLPAESDTGAEFAGFVRSRSFVEQAPVYKGEYKNLSPLYFDTEPVDNANDTSLDRAKLSGYSRAQLFFLLRLERFLRLRQHWLEASPRADESWKTDLVMRGIFSALQDCIVHGVGEDGKELLARWKCC